MSIKIILADDHKMMRDGLRFLISRQSGMEVIAEAENGRMAVQLAKKLKPDIIIMDIVMPDLNGIEATRQIMADCPGIKVIALSMHTDRRYVAGMLKAGVSGYILKDCAFEELATAIRSVRSNQTYLSQKISETLVKDYVDKISKTEEDDSYALTAREREVLQLIAEGQSTKDISTRLHVSVKTVETHRRQLMEKLKVTSVAELTKIAIREGLTSLET